MRCICKNHLGHVALLLHAELRQTLKMCYLCHVEKASREYAFTVKTNIKTCGSDFSQ